MLRQIACVMLPLSLMCLLVGCKVTDRQVFAQANQAHGQLRPAVLNDQMLNGYLEQLEQRILAAAQRLNDRPKAHQAEDTSWMFSSQQMKFHFVNSKTLNAFTTGGEHMYIYTGLLMQCDSEDELAAILCHEYAHVFARHVQQGMNRQYWTMGAALAGGAAGAALGASDGTEQALKYGAMGAGATGIAAQFVGMGFTRDDEMEADKLGFRMYVQAGWDPDRFADFFKRMIKMGLDTTPEMASDHPSLANRVKATDERIADLRPELRDRRREPVAEGREFDRLKARAAKLAENAPEDKSLEDAQTLLASFSSCVAPVAQPEQVQARRRVERETEGQQAQRTQRQQQRQQQQRQ